METKPIVGLHSGSLSDLRTSQDIEKDIGKLEEKKLFYIIYHRILFTLFQLLAVATIQERRLFQRSSGCSYVLFKSGYYLKVTSNRKNTVFLSMITDNWMPFANETLCTRTCLHAVQVFDGTTLTLLDRIFGACNINFGPTGSIFREAIYLRLNWSHQGLGEYVNRYSHVPDQNMDTSYCSPIASFVQTF